MAITFRFERTITPTTPPNNCRSNSRTMAGQQPDLRQLREQLSDCLNASKAIWEALTPAVQQSNRLRAAAIAIDAHIASLVQRQRDVDKEQKRLGNAIAQLTTAQASQPAPTPSRRDSMAASPAPSFTQGFGGGVPLSPIPESEASGSTISRARSARPAVPEASNAARAVHASPQPGHTQVQPGMWGVVNAVSLPSVVENLMERQAYFRNCGQLHSWYVKLHCLA